MAKRWTKDEILVEWPQIAVELRGLQEQIEAQGLPPSKLGVALQLAEEEFRRLEETLPKAMQILHHDDSPCEKG